MTSDGERNAKTLLRPRRVLEREQNVLLAA